MTDNVSAQEIVVSDTENTETVASLFNAWHDLRTAATKEIADFETYKQELEEDFQTRADTITVRNARYNQLLFLLERVKLNLEAAEAGKDAVFPDITVTPDTLLTQAVEWLDTETTYAPEQLMNQLTEAREAERARIEAERAVNEAATAATAVLEGTTVE